MAIRDSLLPEYDHEMATTRRLFQRIPDADLGWTPHEKSMGLGHLANHIVGIPHWCTLVLGSSILDVRTLGPDPHAMAPASVAHLISDFDAKVVAARTALSAAADPDMLSLWTLKQGDHEIFTLPRVAAIRSFVMNHLIHHRGQLTVYLRLRDVALPSIYGPTADEA
jgi:uncharacterized damage-inducible protein DinB